MNRILSERKKFYDAEASNICKWKKKNKYYHQSLTKLVKFLIPENKSILELGCGTGEMLGRLKPSKGVGVDISENMIFEARSKHELDSAVLTFEQGTAEHWYKKNQTYDYILMSDVIGDLSDVWLAFRNLQNHCNNDTKIVITYFNALWEPILKVGEKLGIKMPQNLHNWLALSDIDNLLKLNGFEIIKKGQELLYPKYIPFISAFLNQFISRLPLFNKLNLITYVVAQCDGKALKAEKHNHTVTIIVPCRNEKGNIQDAVERIPNLGSTTEILFVDGNSNDGTVEEIKKVIELYKGEKDVKLLHQVPPDDKDGQGHGKMLKLGKGDAVRKGFEAAKGEIIMILDADLTVPPEELYMFFYAIVEGRGKFINGTRLVYPMEKQAMRFLNKLANYFFGLLFSWLLEQRIKDTLCGTKVLYKKDYNEIVKNRDYFGDFDPFGDFDLLFGAAKNNLKIIEVPVHYAERKYGEIKIERFKHGILLIKMSFIAMKKLKFRIFNV